MRGARSVGPGSRRGAKGGLRIGEPKQLFRIRPGMEPFADAQPSLALLVLLGSRPAVSFRPRAGCPDRTDPGGSMLADWACLTERDFRKGDAEKLACASV